MDGRERRYGIHPSMSKGLSSYLRPHTRALSVGVLLLLVTNALEKSIPWLLKLAIDALQQGAFDEIGALSLAVAAVAGAMWFVRTLSRIRLFNVGRDVEYQLRNELLEQVHVLGPSFFRTMPTGDIMSRATNDLGQIRLLVGFGLLGVANTVFAFAGAIALMLAISPKLTLFVMLPVPLFVAATRVFSKRLFVRSRAAQEAIAGLAERTHEDLAGIRLVRSFGIEEHAERRFDEAAQEVLRHNMKLVTLRGLMWPVLMTLNSLGTLVLLWQGGTMLVDGSLTAGEFAALLAYYGQLIWPTLALGFILSVVQRGRASYGRVREVLDAVPEVQDVPNAVAPTGAGQLEVRGLSFAYGDTQALEDVSFATEAQRSVALVGRTGSGKSTLAKLLARLLPTDEGQVFLDGTDVTKLRLADLRRAIGLAQQEPFLFSTTVARNLAFALDDPEGEDADRRIRRATREAAVLAEIEALPNGFDTVVGERGVQLSGGQRQRLALARALLNSPCVLVLDDPLSAVDASTEATILEALDRAGEGRTVVLITNRVAAAARADQVVVLDGGGVIERGSHEELLQAGGLYARLAARQQLEQELDGL